MEGKAVTRPSVVLLLALALLGAAPANARAAPALSVPSVALVQGTVVKATGIKARLSWPAASGDVARYQLQRRVDGGAWANVTLPSARALSVTLRMGQWTHNQFRLRAFDGGGSAGPWSATAPSWVSATQESDAPIDFSSGWQTRSDSSALGGAVRTSSEGGATATFTFSGTHLAWIAQRGPKRGRASISVNGQHVATVDLYASIKQPRRVAFATSWSSAAERTVRITVQGTTNRPKVDVDAFFTLSPPASAVLVGAGDIGVCGSSADQATGDLIEAIPGTVFTTGDNAYPDGTAQQFADCYGPAWGGFKARTRPAPGNHDYNSSGAGPYFAYFGANAGQAGTGYYAYEAGTWRVYSLNSECSYVGGCVAGSAQYEWLRRDLAANPHRCVAAYWHRPRFSSGHHGSSTRMADIVGLLYDAQAELILAGHDHSYERLARIDVQGNINSTRGIRHFVVGTGGAPLYAWERAPLAQTVVRDNTTHGVLKLELTPGSYGWVFLPTVKNGFSDAGSASCH